MLLLFEYSHFSLNSCCPPNSHGLAQHHHDSINSHFICFCGCSNTHYIILFSSSTQFNILHNESRSMAHFNSQHCIAFAATLCIHLPEEYFHLLLKLWNFSFFLFRNKRNKCCNVLCHGRIFSQESVDVNGKTRFVSHFL